MLQGNLVVGQSGGPTAAINASLCGVIEGAMASGFDGKILGMVHGIEGLLKENFIDLGEIFADPADREKLVKTPSAYLGSCRKKLAKPEVDPTDYNAAFEVFKKHNIRYFLYIGGNDSMDTVYRLSEYAKKIDYDICIMGVPKTIDNDLNVTDHCPGYGSAAKFIATAIREMARDTRVYDMNSVLIVEIMGRNAGWLAAASALARGEGHPSPELIYLPEAPFKMDEFLEDVDALVKQKKVVIVAISEGIRDENGVYVCESTASGAVDVFGHKYLSGAGKVLENAVRDKLGYKARAVELNVFQRCAAHLASKTDLTESRAVGKAAAEAAISGMTGRMMAYVRESTNPYKLSVAPCDIAEAANIEKMVPREWLNERGNDVTEEFVAYARPLIEGESYPEYEDGLPVHIIRP